MRLGRPGHDQPGCALESPSGCARGGRRPRPSPPGWAPVGRPRPRKERTVSVPNPTTGTPSVSSASTVARTSSSDFTPEHTTIAGVQLSTARSAETSGRDRVATIVAADAAGGQDGDAGQTAGGERCPDRRRAERAVNDAGGEIAWADLACVRARGGDSLQLLVVETYLECAVQYGDGRRDPAAVAHALLAFPSDGQTLGRPGSRGRRSSSRGRRSPAPRRGPPGSRGEYLTTVTSRHCSRRRDATPGRFEASSMPPTRKPAASASPAPVGSTTSAGRASCSSRTRFVRRPHRSRHT